MPCKGDMNLGKTYVTERFMEDYGNRYPRMVIVATRHIFSLAVWVSALRVWRRRKPFVHAIRDRHLDVDTKKTRVGSVLEVYPSNPGSIYNVRV